MVLHIRNIYLLTLLNSYEYTNSWMKKTEGGVKADFYWFIIPELH